MSSSPENNGLLNSVDARTKLAGSNKMEILLFTLGTRETFGINVFKVREVTKTPPITKTPNMPQGVEGVISLRGHIIPVISLARFVSGASDSAKVGQAMMVTEYSRRTQGFLVEAVVDPAEHARVVNVVGDLLEAAVLQNDGRQRGRGQLDEMVPGAIQPLEHFARRTGGTAMRGWVTREAGCKHEGYEVRITLSAGVAVCVAGANRSLRPPEVVDVLCLHDRGETIADRGVEQRERTRVLRQRTPLRHGDLRGRRVPHWDREGHGIEPGDIGAILRPGLAYHATHSFHFVVVPGVTVARYSGRGVGAKLLGGLYAE